MGAEMSTVAKQQPGAKTFARYPETIVNDPLAERGYDPDIELNATHVEIEYPRSLGSKNAVTVGLCCVRAASGLLIVYDFVRDGWSIMRDLVATNRSDGAYAGTIASNVEVCFIPASTEVQVDAP